MEPFCWGLLERCYWLLLGVGMCLSMVFGKMVLGIAVGIIGIVVLLIPLTKGLK